MHMTSKRLNQALVWVSSAMLLHVQIAGDRGLVWDIQDILKLRKEYRLVGCMIGGISKFQSQVAVMGLPLQLSPEEVSLAAAAGWVQLYGLDFSIPTAAAAAALPWYDSIPHQQQQEQATQQQPPQDAAQQQQQSDPMQCDNPEEFDEFYAAYYGLEAPQQQEQQPQQQQQQQQQQQVHTTPQPAEPPVQQQHKDVPAKQQQDAQAWQQTLKSSRFPIPMTVADAAAGFEGGAAVAAASDQQQRRLIPHPSQPQQQQQQGERATSSSGIGPEPASSPYCQLKPVTWQYPGTALQWLRLSVFADLHSRGFCVTGGAKFGGDYLAYPGDPHLYHAQYVIRVVLPDQVLVPSVLQGLARGVHAARKHLVLATVQPAASTAAAAAGGGGFPQGSAAAATAAAVGGLVVTNGVGANVSSNSSSQITAAAAAVSAAATVAACQALFAGLVPVGPVHVGSAEVEAGAVGGGASGAGSGVSGVLRYITIARETGWSGE